MSLHLLARRRILNLKTPTIKKELQSQKRTWLSFFKSFSNFFFEKFANQKSSEVFDRHNWWWRPGESHSCPKPDRRWVQLTVKTPLVSLLMWHVFEKNIFKSLKGDVERCWDRAPLAINTVFTSGFGEGFKQKTGQGFPFVQIPNRFFPFPLGEFTGLNAGAIYHQCQVSGFGTSGPFLSWFFVLKFGEGRFHHLRVFASQQKLTIREIGSAKIRWSEFVVAKYFPMAAARGTRQDQQWINWENGGNLSDPHL